VAIDWQKEQQEWQGLHPNIKREVNRFSDNFIMKDGRAFSTETGVDITHIIADGKKTTAEQVRGLQAIDEMSEHQIENGKFMFAFFKQLTTMESRFPSLTKQDSARLMYLGTFTAWKTNRLQTDNGKKHYTKKDIGILVDMSSKRFNEFFRKLENEGIIEEKETGEVYMNQTVFYRGKLRDNDYDVSDLDHTRLFRKTVRDLYAEFKGRRLAQLSVIYSIIPFLNFNYNIVCHNPSETSEDLVEPMGLDELTKILDYSNTTVLKQSLNRIKVDGKPVFGFFENPYDRRKFRIVVNPRVVFAGNNDSLRAIKVLFN